VSSVLCRDEDADDSDGADSDARDLDGVGAATGGTFMSVGPSRHIWCDHRRCRGASVVGRPFTRRMAVALVVATPASRSPRSGEPCGR